MIQSAEAMLDWYWKLCVQDDSVVLSVKESCQVWVWLGEQAAMHCNDAVIMSPGLARSTQIDRTGAG